MVARSLSVTRDGEDAQAEKRTKEMLGLASSKTNSFRGSLSEKLTEMVSGPKIMGLVEECRKIPCSMSSRE